MMWFRRRCANVFWATLVFLPGSVGCSRPVNVPVDQSPAQTAQHQTPFQQEGSQAGTGESQVENRTTRKARAQDDLPFQDSQNLPAGTLVTVQLKNRIDANRVDSQRLFEAVVVEPVMVGGNLLIPSGTSVAGRVESARASEVRPNRGYVCLALQSVQLGGMDVPVQTASLFARQSSITGGTGSLMHLEKGRRLTFRLTEAVYPSIQRAQAIR